jgi:hypothetical protein
MLARTNSVAAIFDVVLVSDAGLACWELFGTAVGSGIVERAGDMQVRTEQIILSLRLWQSANSSSATTYCRPEIELPSTR